jgi:signal transduction histidine kinase
VDEFTFVGNFRCSEWRKITYKREEADQSPMTYSSAMANFGWGIKSGGDDAMVATFIRLDGIVAAVSLLVVVVVNLVFVQSAWLWALPASLVVLIAALALAESERRSDRLTMALGLITAGNWLVAIVAPITLPFLWPVLILVVILPVVLAAPHLANRPLLVMTVGASLSVVGVALIGLTGDDRGAAIDTDDVLETVLVVALLAALTVPIIVVVWQANRLLKSALARSRRLNRELSDTAQQLIDSRRRVVNTGDSVRIEFERDLHDGAEQRLVALGTRLRLMKAAASNAAPVQETMSELIDELDEAVEELREFGHGVYPPVLGEHGLAEALDEAAGRSSNPVEVSAGEVGRFSREVETTVYLAALEALSNAAKHAPDSDIQLSLGVNAAGTLTLTITDNGPGFDLAAAEKSRGILNMGDRIESIDGELRVVSAVGAGTSIVVVVPMAPQAVED